LHVCDETRAHHDTDRLPLSDADIEEIFLEGEFSIFHLELSHVVSFCCIDIEYPDIIYSKPCDQDDEYYIDLGEGKPKILTSSLPLREKWDMSLFRYEDVRIHGV
jgi:hypothetical protein